jgi:hypothetical protein
MARISKNPDSQVLVYIFALLNLHPELSKHESYEPNGGTRLISKTDKLAIAFD